MTKASTLIVLLLQLLCTLLEVPGQQSPCPEYFKYITDSATNETMGQIQILAPPRNTKLNLKVAISVASALPTDYVGKIELTQSKAYIDRTFLHGGPLLYHLRFPLRQPVPLLTGMWFNDKQYCSGPRASGNIVTSIMLRHTLAPAELIVSFSLVLSQWSAAETEFLTSHFGDFAAGTQANLKDITSTELTNY